MRKIVIVLVLSLFCRTIYAQEHVNVVRTAKAAVVAAGINPDLPGPEPTPECPRFEITKRVAWQLRAEGSGLLSKPIGNNCNGYSVDIVAYPNGRIIDILGGGTEGPNTPQWNELAPVDPARWRAPIEVGDGGGNEVTKVDLDLLRADLINQINGLRSTLDAVNDRVSSLDNRINETTNAVGAVIADVQVLKSKKIPTGCRTAINLGAARIPISCSLIP